MRRRPHSGNTQGKSAGAFCLFSTPFFFFNSRDADRPPSIGRLEYRKLALRSSQWRKQNDKKRIEEVSRKEGEVREKEKERDDWDGEDDPRDSSGMGKIHS